jgi:ABC-type bacteriocin/lantibiotic exporter with double-glycine peptidase domain
MQDKIGFNKQDDYAGNCAQRSLIHALLLLGAPISERDAHKMTGIPKWLAGIRGTREEELKKGIKKAGFNFREFQTDEAEEARRWLDDCLRRGIPVIPYIWEYEHWAVIAGLDEKSKSYYWIDTIDGDLYGSYSWNNLRRWIENEDSEEDNVWRFYFLAIEPKSEDELARSIVTRFASVY